MSFFEKIGNSIQYQMDKALSNPEADQYAQKKAAEAATEKALQDARDKALQKQTDKAARDKVASEKQIADEKAKKERASFNFTRMFGTVFGTFLTIFIIFLVFFLGVLGSSLATNLNLYHSLLYRILYAVYGFLFFFIVIPYVLGYRWFWKGKRPKFYSLIPIIPYHIDNRFMAFLFSWLSFKPDDQIECLKEWIKEQHE